MKKKIKKSFRTGAKIRNDALTLAGYGEAADTTRIATNVIDFGFHYLMKP